MIKLQAFSVLIKLHTNESVNVFILVVQFSLEIIKDLVSTLFSDSFKDVFNNLTKLPIRSHIPEWSKPNHKPNHSPKFNEKTVLVNKFVMLIMQTKGIHRKYVCLPPHLGQIRLVMDIFVSEPPIQNSSGFIDIIEGNEKKRYIQNVIV